MENQESQTQEVSSEGGAPKKESASRSFWELLRFGLLAMLIVLPIRIFIAQPFVVSGSSMYPTFNNGEYLIIDEISYRLADPKRYDVVVFRYPNDTTKFFIKRVIGLPNETVDIDGEEVRITNDENKDGFVVPQPYVKHPSSSNTHLTLKENEYFVMGDNRGASSDSRYWGPVSRDLIVGKAVIRLLPVDKINLMPGGYKE